MDVDNKSIEDKGDFSFKSALMKMVKSPNQKRAATRVRLFEGAPRRMYIVYNDIDAAVGDFRRHLEAFKADSPDKKVSSTAIIEFSAIVLEE